MTSRVRAAGTDVTFDMNGHKVNHNTAYQNGANTGYTYLFTTAYHGKLTVEGLLVASTDFKNMNDLILL